MKVTDDYVSLHMHSDNSILDGFAKVEEYVDMAVDLGQRAIGLTDHGSLSGLYTFVNYAKKRGISPVPGCEFYVAPQNPLGARVKEGVFYRGGVANDVAARGAYLHLTVWAINNVGLHNLFKLSTLSFNPDHFFRKPRIDFDMLVENSEGLAIATGCPSSEISTRFLLDQDKEAYDYAGRLKDVFQDRMFVEIMDHHMDIDLERSLIPKQLEMAKRMNLPLLATNDCHYAHKHDAQGHEELLCIQSNSVMTDKTYDEGGRRFAFKGNEYYLKSFDEMRGIFPDEDFPGALSNTSLLAEMASDISLNYDPHLKPKITIPDEFDSELDYYKHLIKKGMRERYGHIKDPEVRQEVIRRNKEEFEVIYSSDFIGYMLVVRDYLEWTKQEYSTRDKNGNIIASSIGVGRGCFLPGNMVTTNIGIKPIETIRPGVGVNVLTHEGTFNRVIDRFEYDVDDEVCVKLTLSDGKEITCTADHEMYTKLNGFVQAGQLKQGDELVGATRNACVYNYVKVDSVEFFRYTGKVYDLHVENIHNYTVSGVTVHNSVGGSIHAYELGISEIDPIRYDLLFERFLSAGRGAVSRIVYDDGTVEELIASDKKKIIDSDGNERWVYVHQLEPEENVIDEESE